MLGTGEGQGAVFGLGLGGALNWRSDVARNAEGCVVHGLPWGWLWECLVLGWDVWLYVGWVMCLPRGGIWAGFGIGCGVGQAVRWNGCGVGCGVALGDEGMSAWPLPFLLPSASPLVFPFAILSPSPFCVRGFSTS